MLNCFSHVQLFVSPWTVAWQEYWSLLPCPPPGDLPNPGISQDIKTKTKACIWE